MSGVYPLRVPLKVDVKAGPNQADAKGIEGDARPFYNSESQS